MTVTFCGHGDTLDTPELRTRLRETIIERIENEQIRSCSRNLWMVENSSVIIANVSHGWGGAAQTLEYAVKKKKTVFNFGKQKPDD